jgi:hypothetical protein
MSSARFFMLICSHPHEDSLSFAHSFPWDLRVSSQHHGGAPPLLPLCACLHLHNDDGVGFHELCILLLHELRDDGDDFHLRILLLHELRGDGNDFHLRILLLHELRGDGNDFHLRILLLHELRGDDFHHHELRVGLLHDLLHGAETVLTSTTTTSASASSTTVRQVPERATTSDPWQRWRRGSSSSTVAARVLLYGGGKQGLDLGSVFLFLKIIFSWRFT